MTLVYLLFNGGNTGGEHGYAGSFATGSGAGLTPPIDISGPTFSIGSTGQMLPVIFFE